MAKPITVEMDATRLTGALRELSRLTGADFKTVVRVETQKVLEASMKYTPAAKVSDIKENAESWEFITASSDIYIPKTTRSTSRYQGFLPKGGSGISRVVYYRFNRYPAELWAKLMELKKAQLARRIMARGLLKKSWIQVSEKIGIALSSAPRYAAQANVRGKDYPQDTSGGERRSISNFEIWGVIERVYDSRIRGALQRAMRGRAKYFEANLKNGVFLKSKEIAAKYPGLYVNG